ADLRVAQEALTDLVDRAVVLRDDVGITGYNQLRSVDPPRVDGVDLVEQDGQVDNDSVADDRRHAGAEDTRRKQVQGVGLAADDDRVPGVVAAVVLDDVVDLLAE